MKCLWIRLCSISLLAVALGLTAACSGAQDGAATQIPSAPESELPLPAEDAGAPPSPQEALRNLSSWPGTAPMIDVREVQGGLHFSNVEQTGKGLSFDPDENGLAHAVFVMAPGSKSLEPLIELDWTPEHTSDIPLDSVYVGLADFEKNRWRWFQVKLDPENEDVLQVHPDALGSYVNDDGLLLLAVVVTQEIPRNLETIKVGGNILPSIEIEITSNYSSQAELHWEVFDVDSDLVLVEIDSDADGVMDYFIDPPSRGRRLSGQIIVNIPQPGIYSFSAHAEDADGSHWQDEWEFILASNSLLPQPVLTMPENNIVQRGESFSCDASLSSDPDGHIISYRWKVSGRISYEAKSADQPVWETVLTECGLYSVELTVVDNSFNKSTVTALIEVVEDAGRRWRVHPSETDGEISRLCMINGRPAMATAVREGISYQNSYDTYGQSWGEVRSVYATGQTGYAPAQLRMMDNEGRPLILYTRYTSTIDQNYLALYAVQASNAQGSQWSTAHKLFDFIAQSHDIALTAVNGKPGVLLGYSNEGFSRLVYWQAGDAGVTSWQPALELHNTNSLNVERVDLAWDGVRPVALFNAPLHDQGEWSQQSFVQAGADSSGNAWQQPSLITLPGGRSPERPQFFEFEGQPAIVAGDHDYLGNNRIWLLTAEDESYSGWNVRSEITPLQLDLVSYIELVDAAVSNGKPGILYIGQTSAGTPYTSGLFYVEALDASGTGWAAPRLIRDNVIPGMHVPPRASLIDSYGTPLAGFCTYGSKAYLGCMY